eukprot:PhM_4_TR3405/c0_g1_i1/m.106558/K04946/KCNT1; potassium channel subfamily T member 1
MEGKVVKPKKAATRRRAVLNHPVLRHVVKKHVRSTEQRETRLSRFVSKMQFMIYQDHPYWVTSGLLLLILLEIMCIGTYIWVSEAEVHWDKDGKTGLNEFNTDKSTFIFLSFLNFLFTIEWLAYIAVARDPMKALFDLYSLVALLTCVPMNILSFGAMSDFDSWSQGFVPLFLRVWWAYLNLEWLVSIPQLNLDTLRVDVCMSICHLAAIMCSSAGVYQVVESFSASHVSFFDSTYFTIVTFSTVGYGDITPNSRLGRAVLLVIISLAVVFLPQTINAVSEFILLRRRFTRYHNNRTMKHVLVVGPISRSIMSDVLNEFFGGTRSLRPINVAFMNPNGFDDDALVLARDPWWARRLTLIHGDPKSRADLDRARGDAADAVFVLLDRDQPSTRGDMDVLQTTWTINNYDSELPVYAIMKRPGHANFTAHSATSSVLELEELKFALIGQSVTRPGVIPLVINLMRTVDVDVDAEDTSWVARYDHSRSNELYCMDAPAFLVGLPFLAAALIFKKRYGGTIIGVASEDIVRLNPVLETIHPADEIIYIALDELDEEDMLELTPEEHAEARELPSTTVCFPHQSRTISESALQREVDHPVDGVTMSHTVTSIMDVNDDDGELLTPVLQNRDAMNFLRAMNLKDHVVLLELSSTLEVPELSPEELTESEKYQCKDLYNILEQIKYDDPQEKHEIVVLGRAPLSEAFLQQWATQQYRPIVYVEGCGTAVDCLDLLHIQHAAAVIILSSSAGSFDLGDTVIGVVQHSVQRILDRHAATTPEPRHVPILVELDTISTMHLFRPHYSAKALRRGALEDFTAVPKFVAGEAICSTMLDTALYQTYTNRYMLEILKRLVVGGWDDKMETAVGAGTPTSQVRLRSVSVESLPLHAPVPTFEDVFECLLRMSAVAVGLYRVASPSAGTLKYMHTNPLLAEPVEITDIVHFLA